MGILVIALSINPRPLSALELKLSGLIMESRVDTAGDNQNAHVIISKYLHCRFLITSDVSIYLTSLNVSHFRTSNAYNSVVYENIKCGYSFSWLERKEQCGTTKIICVFTFFFFFHFHGLPCELENARVLYKIKRFFFR